MLNEMIPLDQEKEGRALTKIIIATKKQSPQTNIHSKLGEVFFDEYIIIVK